MTLEIDGLRGHARFRALIAKKLDVAFERHGVRAVATRVVFADENGPKGGVGIRCGVTVELPRRPTLHIDHLAEDERTAFDGALEALERQVTRDRGRLREQRRRPKKYFLAKRLLAPEGGIGPASGRASRRRSA